MMLRIILLGSLIAGLCTLPLFAQTVPIHSQTLNQDTTIDFPTRPCQFDDGATIVTNGFALKIRCISLTAQRAEILSFQGKAANGPNGATATTPGGNGQDGQDGTYGRRGSKVVLLAQSFIGQTNSLMIRVNGEDGGDGGNGGNGAAGTNGGQGDGPDVSDCWIGSCRRAGGNGGNGTGGGNAGYGGRGADGGNGGILVLGIPNGGDHIGFEAHGGIGGLGGKAGAVGAGGQGGPGGNGDKCCGGGHPGANGAPGRGGDDGRPGRNGIGGDLILVGGTNVRGKGSTGKATQMDVAFAEDCTDRAGIREFLQTGKLKRRHQQ